MGLYSILGGEKENVLHDDEPEAMSGEVCSNTTKVRP